MPLSTDAVPVEQDLTVIQNNDETFSLALTYNGAVFVTTGFTLSVVVKASPTATDASGTTFTPTIVNASLGQVTWKLPHANTGTAGTQWWRLDAVDGGGNRTTIVMGNLIIMAA